MSIDDLYANKRKFDYKNLLYIGIMFLVITFLLISLFNKVEHIVKTEIDQNRDLLKINEIYLIDNRNISNEFRNFTMDKLINISTEIEILKESFNLSKS